MREVYREAYPAGRPFLARLFHLFVDPRTYLRTGYLFAMFPMGIAYFVVFVTLLSIGGALIWTLVGPIILLAALYLSRWAGDIEAWLVRHVSGVPIRRPPTTIDQHESFRAQVWTRLIDPTSWTGLAYLFVQFPLGIAVFVMLVVSGAVGGAFVGAPLVLQFGNPPPRINFEPFGEITDSVHALWLIPVGLLILFALAHLVTFVSAVHAQWARLMLGTRAKPEELERIAALRPNELPPAVTPATPAAIHELRTSAPAAPAAGPPALVATDTPVSVLTPREHEILLLLARGYSNAAIAEYLVVTEGTVKTHVRRILAKLGVESRTQAAVYAYESGLLDAPVAGDGLRSSAR